MQEKTLEQSAEQTAEKYIPAIRNFFKKYFEEKAFQRRIDENGGVDLKLSLKNKNFEVDTIRVTPDTMNESGQAFHFYVEVEGKREDTHIQGKAADEVVDIFEKMNKTDTDQEE